MCARVAREVTGPAAGGRDHCQLSGPATGVGRRAGSPPTYRQGEKGARTGKLEKVVGDAMRLGKAGVGDVERLVLESGDKKIFQVRCKAYVGRISYLSMQRILTRMYVKPIFCKCLLSCNSVIPNLGK